MKKYARLCALFLLAVACSVDAAPLPAGVTQGPSVEGITEYDLANGLRVLFAPDKSKPTTTVNTTYLVGSRNENYGETGMAHLLEHLMFKGTPAYPQVWKDFTSRGMRANGSTWTDRTNYFASFNANDENLDWYLRWSADAMTHSFIARKDLDTEMTVVRNELELYENDPFRSTLERTIAAAFTWHSYGKSTIGARSDVENVDISRLQAFYRNFYQPDNAVLILTGSFDEAKTLALIADTFGKIPRPERKIQPTYTIDAAQQGERSVTVRRVGDTQMALAVYHVPAGSSPDYAAVEILETVLGDTPTGRLHKALVETKQAAAAFGFSFAFKEPTIAIFGAQLPTGASLDTAKATLVATIENFAKEPVTQAEVDRARTKYLKQFELTVSDPEKVGVALSTAIGEGDWRLFFLGRDRVRDIKVEDVQRVAAAYFIPDNRTLGLFIPTANPQRPPAPAFVDVAPMVKDYKGGAAVAQGEAFEPTPENIEARAQRFTLADGMKVVLVPKRTRGGTVNAEILLRFGDEKSLLGMKSVSDLTAAMLERGAAGMSRQEIRDAFDRLKARVGIGGGGAVVTVRIETTRENFPEVLKLVANILRRPTFPAAELDQLKNEVVTNLEAQRKEPNSVGGVALSRQGNPYPKGDLRYAEDFDEAIAGVKAATLDEVKAFHARFVGADHGDIAIAGDIDPAAVKPLVAELFGDWKGGAGYTRVPRPLYEVAPASLKIETPDKANAFFAAQLHFALRDDAPDYAAALVANRALGGGPGSVLWGRVREREGLSYGIGSNMAASPFEPHGTLTAFAIYAPQNLAKLDASIQEEMARIQREGFTPEQVAAAKTGLLQARSLARAQDNSLVGMLVDRSFAGRTLAYDSKLDRDIEAVTPGEANAAFRKYFDASRFVTVRAGDFAKGAGK
ncbi:MAG: M16 family metallopeptidase [Usitatibacter sp.]